MKFLSPYDVKRTLKVDLTNLQPQHTL